MKAPPKADEHTGQAPGNTPLMPFNEALKRVWAAKPMPKVKQKPSAKPAHSKPAE